MPTIFMETGKKIICIPSVYVKRWRVLNILFVCFLRGGGGGEKKEIFLWYKDFVDNFFGGSSQNFRGHFYAFSGQSFLKVNGVFLGVAKISNIFCCA